MSLWLDEILDLQVARSHWGTDLFNGVAHNAGAAPLGYLAQALTLKFLGVSAFSGRLPSAVFSVLACAGLWVLARQARLLFPLLPALLLALAPLQFRYAMEARPYAQALAISVWMTVSFIGFLASPRLIRALLYSSLTLAGLYTFPFLVFVAISHFVWLLPHVHFKRSRRTIVLCLAFAVAVAGFVPWYLKVKGLWSTSIAASHLHSGIDAKTPLLVLHELIGGGYAPTIIVLSVGLFALASKPTNRLASLCAACAIGPMILALLADFESNYFFAIRQAIAVLPPLLLLAALGIEKLFGRHRKGAVALAAVVLLLFVYGDVRFMLRPRENWKSAAVDMQRLASQGACLIFVPSSSEYAYEFFVPDLSAHACGERYLNSRKVAVAQSPYAASEDSALLGKLRRSGFKGMSDLNRYGPKVSLYQRKQQDGTAAQR